MIDLLIFLANQQTRETKLVKSEKVIKCYSCLGLDLDNCMHGESYCNGVCWKLTDREKPWEPLPELFEDHSIIAKGCSKQRHELTGEEGDFQTGIKLYWAHKEELKGSAVFCNNDYCNSAQRIDLK
uniref:Uncharacterized protein n=1 Tax=Romanomermis culicivorax TaxID=13658 RepID=A0A915HYU6_ROMCU